MKISEIKSKTYGSKYVTDADSRSYQLLIKIRTTLSPTDSERRDMLEMLELCEQSMLLAIIDDPSQSKQIVRRIRQCKNLLNGK